MADTIILSSSAGDFSLTSGTEPIPGCCRDEELVEACRNGSLPAFEQLYRIHGSRMKSIALNLLGNVTDAEDAVQESFMKICRRINAFRGDAAFSTWVFRLLVNTCYDLARKRQRLRGSPVQSAALEKEMSISPADHPLRLTLERSLRHLDARSRLVFLLFEVEGFSHREIAAILEIREGTSKSLLFDAKKKLQRWISNSARIP